MVIENDRGEKDYAAFSKDWLGISQGIDGYPVENEYGWFLI